MFPVFASPLSPSRQGEVDSPLFLWYKQHNLTEEKKSEGDSLVGAWKSLNLRKDLH